MEDSRENRQNHPQEPSRSEGFPSPVNPTQPSAYPPPSVPPYGGYSPPFPPNPNTSPPYQQGAYPNSPPHYGSPSGQYPSNGQPPAYGYPPQMPPTAPGQYPGLTPVNPPKKGLKVWHWVLIGIGSALMVCCVGGIIIAAAIGTTSTGQQASTSTNIQHREQVATATLPRKIPTNTPVSLGSGDHMALGSNYAESGGTFTIVHPKDSFGINDQLAYVITLDQSIGMTQMQFSIVHVDAQGAEETVLSQAIPVSNPNFAAFANRIQIGTILAYYGQTAGNFRLEMSDGHSIVAQADFIYTGASAST